MYVPQLAVKSNSKQWAETGKSLFSNKRYSQAAYCYGRAAMPQEAAVANAYSCRETARKIPPDSAQNSRARSKAFIVAAYAYKDCAASAKRMKHKYLRSAGECFESGGDDLKAASAYLEGEEFTRAAQSYCRATVYDTAMEIIRAHRDSMDSKVVEQLIEEARLLYFKEKHIQYVVVLPFN
jgi:hypothetical protein